MQTETNSFRKTEQQDTLIIWNWITYICCIIITFVWKEKWRHSQRFPWLPHFQQLAVGPVRKHVTYRWQQTRSCNFVIKLWVALRRATLDETHRKWKGILFRSLASNFRQVIQKKKL